MKHSLQVLIGISVLVLAIAFAIHLTITKPARELGEEVIHAGERTATHGIDKTADIITQIPEILATVFQAQVNVSTSASVCDATPIAELAVLQRNIREIIDYSGYRLLQHQADCGSTKRLWPKSALIWRRGFRLRIILQITWSSFRCPIQRSYRWNHPARRQNITWMIRVFLTG